MKLPRRLLASVAATALAAAAAALPAVPALAITPVPSGLVFTVRAATLTPSDLTFTGCVDSSLSAVACAGATTMAFTASDVTLDGYVESLPCQASGAVHLLSVNEAQAVALSGAVAIYAQSFVADQAGWSPATPPPGGTLSGPYTNVVILAVLVHSAAVTETGGTAYAAICEQPAPVRPKAAPSPAASPTPAFTRASPSSSVPPAW